MNNIEMLNKIKKSESDIIELNEQLEENTKKIEEVARTGTTTEVLQATTETYLQEKINDGTIANLTIEKK